MNAADRQRRARRRDLLPLARRLGRAGREGRGARERLEEHRRSGARSSDLKLILWDLAQQEYLNESSRLAQAVQEEMNRITGIQSRGVKQAPFKVLVGATMPAALVEVAFITNPDEESKIKSDAFQKTVVDALTTARRALQDRLRDAHRHRPTARRRRRRLPRRRTNDDCHEADHEDGNVVRRAVVLSLAILLVAGGCKKKPLSPNLNAENKVAVRPVTLFFEGAGDAARPRDAQRGRCRRTRPARCRSSRAS